MDAVWQVIKTAKAMIFSQGQLLGLFLIALIFLFLSEKRKNKALFVYCLLALIFIGNPFVANDLIDFYFPAGEYWYAFLLLPIGAICAYCFVEAVNMQKKDRKWLVFIALVFICYLAGIGLGNRENLQKNTTRAYVDEEYLNLFLKMDVEGEPIILLANDEILESARAYSTVILMPYEVTLVNQSREVTVQFYGDDLMLLHAQMQDPLNCLGNITKTSRRYQCNYLILPIEADERWEMENGGYRVLYETEDWVLYHDETRGK
ncbi:MAG: hypothetical protein J1E61_00620 [Lachnospiraceae bacterium]|nr:hypothetical protein [Lachnospiraceae bacterium]